LSELEIRGQIGTLPKKLQFSCSQREGCCLMKTGRGRQCPPGDMGNDLIPEREESLFVGMFILMDMERRDPQRIVPFRADFIVGDPFAIHPDVEHQHVEMQ